MYPPEVSHQCLQNSLAKVTTRLQQLRRPQVLVVAVTKRRSPADFQALIDIGHKHLGENYLSEARNKVEQLFIHSKAKPNYPILHHIGPLQSGQARQIARWFTWVHGISSLSALKALAKAALHHQEREQQSSNIGSQTYTHPWPIRYLIQIRLTNEDSKAGGMAVEEFRHLDSYPENQALRFSGLMAMGPQSQDPIETQEVFCQLRELRDTHATGGLLSMGMSGDWEIAVKEGADIIRLGRLLFKP